MIDLKSASIPEFSAFESACNAWQGGSCTGEVWIPVVRRLMSDALTPVLAYRRLVRTDSRMSPSFLFESVEGGGDAGARSGRYSFLGARPVQQVLAHGQQITLRDADGVETQYAHASPLEEMSRLSKALQVHVADDMTRWLPSFYGGWVGFVGYDSVRWLEPEKLSQGPIDDRHLPDMHMQLYRDIVAFDHVQKVMLLVTHAQWSEGKDIQESFAQAQSRLDDLVSCLQKPDAGTEHLVAGHVDLTTPPPVLPESNLGTGGYQQAVRNAKEYIAAGDAFQIVPSQRFSLNTTADPFDVYRALRVVNPSPYMAYLQIDGGMLVASSPEILCRVRDRQLINRPLAGTRHRGENEVEDQALEQDLKHDPKDTAEHVMLVDLGRNDVGRVATPGSIDTPELMIVERYSHVMHLSSTVTGTLRDELTAWDALRVTLPVGTVSGAPKIRAMQIIDELETVRRGPYAGAIGYADLQGNMDMAIALRTMVVIPDGDSWRVDLQAGAGVVADSDPDAEHQETVNKAAAMAKAVELAARSFS